MRGNADAFRRLATDFCKRLVFPAIAAQEWRREAKLARLFHDQRAFGIIAGGEDNIRVGRLEGGELGFEILVAFRIPCFRDKRGATRLDTLLKIFGQIDTVGRVGAEQNGDALRFELFQRKFGHDRTLEGIDEASAENIITYLCYLGISRRWREHGDLGCLTDGSTLQRAVRSDFAEDRSNLTGDELMHGSGALSWLGCRVFTEQLELAT